MNPVPFASASTLRLGRGRARAAILASAVLVSCALPISAASGAEQLSATANLSVLNQGGTAVEITGKVTLAQLAAELNLSVPDLILRIEALPGNGAISAFLNGLITNPNATLQDVLNELTANGLPSGSVEQLLSSLIGVPNGSGGVTLTVINSPSGLAGAAGAAGPAGAGATRSLSNAFSVVSVKLTKAGLIVETVKVPSAGRLSVKGAAKGKVASAARRSRTRSSTKGIRIAPASTNIAAGIRTITLHPSKVLKRARHIVVSLLTTYAPTGGASSSKRSTVTFRGV